MHDLIHDLALSIAKNEFRNASLGSREQEIYKRIKEVSFLWEEGVVGEEVPKSFLENDSSVGGVMPTIWGMCIDGKGGGGDRIDKLVKTCISKLKHLRTMNLSNVTYLDQLPNSIGTLRHMICLNLSDCKRLKRLPNSITKLYNLETLLLSGCEELEDLINLKHLAITTKQKRLPAATGNGIISSCVPNLDVESAPEIEDGDDQPEITAASSS